MPELAKKTVTDCLVEALEHADMMESVIVIYECKKDSETSRGFLYNDECDIKTANYMVDSFKSWLLQGFEKRE